MPTFTIDISDRKEEEIIDFEYEVWCSVCGAGICGNVQKRSRGFSYRRANEIHIEPCDKCLENERDKVIYEKDDLIFQLEKELEETKKELSRWESGELNTEL